MSSIDYLSKLFSFVNKQSIPMQHQWVSGTVLVTSAQPGCCSMRTTLSALMLPSPACFQGFPATRSAHAVHAHLGVRGGLLSHAFQAGG